MIIVTNWHIAKHTYIQTLTSPLIKHRLKASTIITHKEHVKTRYTHDTKHTLTMKKLKIDSGKLG